MAEPWRSEYLRDSCVSGWQSCSIKWGFYWNSTPRGFLIQTTGGKQTFDEYVYNMKWSDNHQSVHLVIGRDGGTAEMVPYDRTCYPQLRPDNAWVENREWYVIALEQPDPDPLTGNIVPITRAQYFTLGSYMREVGMWSGIFAANGGRTERAVLLAADDTAHEWPHMGGPWGAFNYNQLCFDVHNNDFWTVVPPSCSSGDTVYNCETGTCVPLVVPPAPTPDVCTQKSGDCWRVYDPAYGLCRCEDANPAPIPWCNDPYFWSPTQSKCIKLDYTPQTICPQGFKWQVEGDYCERVPGTVTPSCNAGYTYSNTQLKCVANAPVVPKTPTPSKCPNPNDRECPGSPAKDCNGMSPCVNGSCPPCGVVACGGRTPCDNGSCPPCGSSSASTMMYVGIGLIAVAGAFLLSGRRATPEPMAG